jgi:hypothetical protein
MMQVALYSPRSLQIVICEKAMAGISLTVSSFKDCPQTNRWNPLSLHRDRRLKDVVCSAMLTLDENNVSANPYHDLMLPWSMFVETERK